VSAGPKDLPEAGTRPGRGSGNDVEAAAVRTTDSGDDKAREPIFVSLPRPSLATSVVGFLGPADGFAWTSPCGRASE